jgi:two-component sensor histidine kinase
VLVVDDEAPLREELAALLRDSGFLLRTAGSAEDALAQLAIAPDIAVVLTDIRMPGLSGIALAEQILAVRAPGRAVEVVLLTAKASLDDATRAMRAGAFDLLLKSRGLDTVAATVGRALERALERRSAELAAEQERIALQALHAAAPIGLGLVGHGLRLDRANAALVELLGIAEGADLQCLWEAVPAAREALETPLRAILAGADAPAGNIRLEFRTRPGTAGGVRRVINLHVYAVPAADGSGNVFAAGLACLDVTAETMLLLELDHRVKNAYASFLGLMQATARSASGDPARETAKEEMAKDLGQRVAALARAHDLVRPSITGAQRPGSPRGGELAALARVILVAHGGGPGGRIAIRGPAVTVGPRTAPGLALVLHELATNALKHGALSVERGSVALTWTVEAGIVRLEWAEAGGPRVTGPPAQPGFGSRLLRQADLGALRQGVALDWSDPLGLHARLALPVAALAT